MKKDINTQTLLATLQEESLATLIKARTGIKRDYQFPEADDLIKVAIGIRRSGKTYFLYQTINQLLNQGIAQERILFISFEDDRLLPLDATEAGQLLDAFYTLHPENHDHCCYLFLDEIQNVENWPLVVRRFLDTKNVQIYLSGSSAKLLSKEIHTNLRGRSLAITIFPYSFSEYLTAHGITEKPKVMGKPSLDKFQFHLVNYFSTGGFPGVQSMPPNEWRATLQTYIDTVILRDIVERYGVTNIALLKYLVMSLIKNVASIFSLNKFYNDIKSQGYRVGKDTLHTYLNYLEDAFLIFTVPYYSTSERIKQNRPKKIYIVDSGLFHIVSFEKNRNYGRLLENLIYLELRRQGKTLYYYHAPEGYEVDFLTVDKEGHRELLQITWDDSDPETLEREMRALTCATEILGIPGRLITAIDYLKNNFRHHQPQPDAL